ncbi:MAG: hypothetical protein PVJ39_01375 [Gammaproteobacteria bacterium]|jgi:hypothetical protein
MKRKIVWISYLVPLSLLPALGVTASLEGQWCENGKPYACYPPVTNQSDHYVCTDSTTITRVGPKSLQWVVNETLHFYTDGLINGKTKRKQIITRFDRTDDSNTNVFEHREESEAVSRSRKLIVRNDDINVIFNQIPHEEDAVKIHQQTTYNRCDAALKNKTYYTALVDCGGTGDYIAGVPEVVDNPLLWNPGNERTNNYNSSCRLVTKCWGGGWAAYAASNDAGEGKKAFGASCGESSRHDAKAQAINTCRESGGTNCLLSVISGFDNGQTTSAVNNNKGIKVETCNYGDCNIKVDD